MVFLLLAAAVPPSAQAVFFNALDFTHFAGQPGASGSANGTGSDAQFNAPRGIAVDGSGNLYVADYYNSVIRKITAAGEVTTLAGLAGTAGSIDGTGSAARFKQPYAVAVDGAGNVYVASWDNTIRKITAAGVVTTLAGSAGAAGSADGTGTAARFNSPSGVAANNAGTLLYVADRGNQTIRKMTSSGSSWVVATLAGTVGSTARVENGVYYIDGTGSAARFYYPAGVALDGAGNVYVTDYQYHLIRKVTAAGTVTTIAGDPGSAGGADGTGAEARFNHPTGIAVDSAGNLFVADQDNHTIRRLMLIGSNWVARTMAGSAGSSGSGDGAGSAVRFNQPQGVAVSGSVTNGTGTVYLADTQNHRITKGTPTDLFIPPVITTATLLPTGTVGAAYSQTLTATGGWMPYSWTLVSGRLPAGLTLSSGGVIGGTLGEMPTAAFTVRVAGADGDAAEKSFEIDVPPTITSTSPLPSGTVGLLYPSQTLTATGGAKPYGWSLASGSLPPGMNMTGSGVIYGTPTLAVNAAIVVRVTGSSGLSSTKSLNLPVNPIIATPGQMPVGTVGAVYSQTLVASGGTAPYIWTAAPGSLPSGWSLSGDGVLTGTPGDQATLGFTVQATDKNGLSATKSFTIAVQPAAPTITTGSLLPLATIGKAYNQTLAVYGGTTPYSWEVVSGDLPAGLQLSGGRIYGQPEVVSTARFTIRVTGQNGLSATKGFDLASDPLPSTAELYSFANFIGLPGTAGTADGTADGALLKFPSGVVLDNGGALYVADSQNHTIRKVTAAGAVTTFAGAAGLPGSTDGTGSVVRFYYPRGMAIDNSGNLYVANETSHTIRKVTPSGAVTTFAGSPGLSGKSDGTGSEARFYSPSGVAVDGAGNLFVADTGNHTIRKVTPAGVVTTFAGSTGISGSSDGSGAAARFYNPVGLAFDSAGNLFVADVVNNTIRKVTPSGVVSTFAGSAGTSGSSDGGGAAARFYYPYGVAVDRADNLFVTDYFNQTIRRATPAGVVTTIAGSATVSGSDDGTGSAARFYQPAAIAIDATGTLYVADARNHRMTKGTPLYPHPTVTTRHPLPNGAAGIAYSQMLRAIGGKAPYVWSLASGSLPSGLILSGSGVISGIPATPITAGFTLKVAGDDGLFSTKAFSLTIDLPGDLNADGHVGIADAILALQTVSGVVPAQPLNKGADVSGDAAIGLPEAVFILQRAAAAR